MGTHQLQTEIEINAAAERVWSIRSDNDQLMVVPDNGDIPLIPVSRRKAADLKNAMALI